MLSFVVEESLRSVKVFWLEQEKVIKELSQVATRLGKEDKNIVSIILFGSLAEKRGTPGSDADILIVLKQDDKPFMDRITEWSEKFVLNFPVEIFPYTINELNNPLAQDAMKKGIILFKREGEEIP